MLSLYCAMLNVFGCSLIYMTCRHQKWLSRPLVKMPWRYIGWLLNLLALAGYFMLFSIPAALLTWVTLQMVVYGLLPLSTLMLSSKKDG